MQGVRGANKQPGEIRTSQNWIGGSRPGNATFVPPPPGSIIDLLGEMEAWWHKEDTLPPLLRVAASHVQFETIHPYLDGNGRIGRMLIALLLTHWGLLSSPLLYLSHYFKAHQAEYYQRLGDVRVQGDWAGWFRFFLEGVSTVATDAAETASALHRQVSEDRKKLHANSKATVSAMQLFEQLPENPVISMPRAVKLLDTTKPTATKAINVLLQCEIIEEVGRNRRNRRYRYRGYLELLK
jgi:Fic family protein